MRRIFPGLLVLMVLFCLPASAQLLSGKNSFTRADSLRGTLSPLRSCYDVNYYHLKVKVDIGRQLISGSSQFSFTAASDFSRLQFDLFSTLNISAVLYKGKKVPFTREFNAVFLTFPQVIRKGTKDSFEVYYSGHPQVAKNPPWDGGFIFSKDKSGNPWVSVACQGLGASSWWPTKDHQSDKPDSVLISISVPDSLQEISNGRLRSVTSLPDGYREYNWFVSNPVNNYNITCYIGKYAHWTDEFQGEKGPLSLDYWSLAEDSTLARPHWNQDVKRMLSAFEHWFGPYPFYEDGYKLVQAPHLGMEHQSAIAYGNHFLQGYDGRDLSGSGWGMKFDFIVIHESGHEWFGNNITARDIADMWIHESFTNYSETLFTESYYGKAAGTAYVAGIRQNIKNDIPVIGQYGVNTEGSGDMYYKGANMIHMIRQLVNDEEKFRQILRGMNKTFYHQTVTTAQVESYLSRQTGLKLDKIFDQYLRTTLVPVLSYYIHDGQLSYRWTNTVSGFEMPVKVITDLGENLQLYPAAKWKSLKLKAGAPVKSLIADPDYYILLKSAR